MATEKAKEIIDKPYEAKVSRTVLKERFKLNRL